MSKPHKQLRYAAIATGLLAFAAIAIALNHQLQLRALGKHIESLGGEIDGTNDPFATDSFAHPLTDWMRRRNWDYPLVGRLTYPWVGIEWVTLQNLSLPASLFDDITSLPRLKSLALINVPLTREQLTRLEHAQHLTRLRLVGSTLDAGSIRNLPRCRHLERLSLTETPLTDDILTALPTFPGLRSLDLGGTGITDRSFPWILQHGDLEALQLSATQITGENIPEGTPNSGIHYLVLADTRVTDEGLARLLTLSPNVDTLILNNCPVTAESVPALAKLPKLERIFITGTGITAKQLSATAAPRYGGFEIID